ncbi:MAG: hypothetical protein KGY70_20285, partial [Bacteroidales bacterium]|nr:hypothetical protein [Bacteroidales bacterium]
AIEKWPELQPGLEFYKEAFHELCTDRPPAMSGVMSIPFSAINNYARAYRITGEDFEDLRYFVRIQDQALVEWKEERRQAEKGTQDKKGQVNF